MKYFVFALFCIVSIPTKAQLKTGIVFSTAYTFNSPLLATDNFLYENKGVFIQSGIQLRQFNNSNFFLETGLYGKSILVTGRTPISRYHSRRFRFMVPVMAGLMVTPNFSVALGVQYQNNKDIRDLNIRKRNNFRHDMIMAVQYDLSPRVMFTHGLVYNFSTPSVYLMHDPGMAVTLGVVIKVNDR